jgi:flavin reductase (DIM6/NTAB) family NADH-FMN oxidoreductase RutF
LSETRSFRDVLGRYPTGVAIVSARVDGRPVGVTVNSFASVSLDPPLVLWSIETGTDRHRLFEKVENYAINILAADQADVAHACAISARLSDCPAEFSDGDVPMLDTAVARLVCRRNTVYPGGDHKIILGEVTRMETGRDVPSLVFYRGRYSKPA